jgi:phosphoglycolate phosphatase-like HAD superfamily hydrolase
MKLAVFDIDGTLTNTNSVDDDCFVAALADAHAIAGISTNWNEYPHTTDSGIMLQIFQERFGRSPSSNELLEFKRCFVRLLEKRHQSASKLFDEIPGAASALDLLRQKQSGWAVSVATGCWRESALMKLRAAKMELEGVPAAYAEDGISREEIILASISKALTHYRPARDFEKIVSIGDGLWDVRAAINLKLAFVGVGVGASAARLRQAGAKHVVADFTDVEAFVRCLNEAEIPGAESL